MSQFYEDEASLFVEAYDAFHQGYSPQIAGDVAFYAEIGWMAARRSPIALAPTAMVRIR